MAWNPITDNELRQIADGMAQAERAGLFDGLFSGECQEPQQLPTKEKLLAGIGPDMRLYKSFFMKVYGYEISFPGFAETALSRLEAAGCSRAREYYSRFVSEYERQRDEELRAVAADMAGKVDEDYKRKVKKAQKGSDGQWSQKHQMTSDYLEISKALGFNVPKKA